MEFIIIVIILSLSLTFKKAISHLGLPVSSVKMVSLPCIVSDISSGNLQNLISSSVKLKFRRRYWKLFKNPDKQLRLIEHTCSVIY